MSIGVLGEIETEVFRQYIKFDEQNHPSGTGSHVEWQAPGGLIGARLADWYRDRCDVREKSGKVTFRDILLEEVAEALAEGEDQNLREELVQVAAVCVTWIDAIDRRAENE